MVSATDQADPASDRKSSLAQVEILVDQGVGAPKNVPKRSTPAPPGSGENANAKLQNICLSLERKHTAGFFIDWTTVKLAVLIISQINVPFCVQMQAAPSASREPYSTLR